ncbi:MAG: hypothetical protein C4K58_05520 [Flavobacteriaceae bacterium]|nr:MAG: hypothetical protein C4K58_05520 [Flavobacteriaceae bacterium]
MKHLPFYFKITFLTLLLCFSFANAQKKGTTKTDKIKHLHSDLIEANPEKYEGNPLFTGNVIFEHKGAKLYADSVILYNIASQKNTFESDVKIENSEYTVTSSRANHYNAKEEVEFFGPSVIQSKRNAKDRIVTTEGRYNLKSQESFLTSPSTIYYDDKILKGNNLYFNQRTGYGKATGNFVLEEPLEDRILSGNLGEVFRNNDSVSIKQNALFEKKLEKESLFFRADNMIAVEKNKQKLVRAFDNAKVFKSDLQGIADSIVFDQSQDIIYMHGNPVAWSSENQITGDSIFVYTRNREEEVDSIDVMGHAFAVSKVEESQGADEYNQIKGKTMDIAVENSQIKNIKVNSNANMLIYLDDKQKGKETERIGVNHSYCGVIYIEFLNKDPELLQCQIGSNSKVYPMEELPKEIKLLPDFKWLESKRPKSKADLQ